jgi:hypothetical protein
VQKASELRVTHPVRVKVAVFVALVVAGNTGLKIARMPDFDPYHVDQATARFAELARSLPARGTFGYVRDPLTPDTAAAGVAQYVLAPRLLLSESAAVPIVADFPEAWHIYDFARSRGLRIVREFGQGVFLLSKRDR